MFSTWKFQIVVKMQKSALMTEKIITEIGKKVTFYREVMLLIARRALTCLGVIICSPCIVYCRCAATNFLLPEIYIQHTSVSMRHTVLNKCTIFFWQRKSFDQELIQGTSLFLPFSLLLAAAVYNYQKVGVNTQVNISAVTNRR